MTTRLQSGEKEKKGLLTVTKLIISITAGMRQEYSRLSMLSSSVDVCSYQMIVALLRSMMLLTTAVEKDNVTSESYQSNICTLLVEATTDIPSNVELIQIIRQLA